jgi:hypothetical protein
MLLLLLLLLLGWRQGSTWTNSHDPPIMLHCTPSTVVQYHCMLTDRTMAGSCQHYPLCSH